MAEQEEKTENVKSLLGRWQNMSRTRQVVIIIAAAAVLALLLFIAQHLSKPQYVTLYSNLDPAQASPLVQYLREEGIPYHLDDFGGTIKVPGDRADELRIEMAGKGIPFAQGLGFEIFDEERLGITDFERQVRMQRALQEELRRTITSLDAVLQARVHLVLPEPSVFLRERGEPSAAVYLKLNPFTPLKQEQIRGIVFLVASGVEGLKAENVIVIDSQGNILYDAVTSTDPMIAVADSALKQLEVKRSFEMELERRVQGMLERVFGPGKALALVTAEMDFDSQESTIISYDENGVPRSSQITEESFEGEGAPAGEVGESNYPGYVGITPGGESSYERREETVNYEIGESSQRTITAPGKILCLHTSVVIDNGQNPLAQQQIQQVNNLISAAIGFDEERGDLVSVEGMSFDRSFEEKMDTALAEAEQLQQRQDLIRQAVTGGVIIIVFILLLIAWRRWRRALREEQERVPTAPETLEQLIALEEEEIPELSPEETPQGRVRKMIDSNLEVAISILRSWIIEE
ncbi:MAG: flagellar M-ring protein FliF [Firmicutes bacterium]|nr:flagellar M-ring protein FliF [Bacillota bacterium]